MFLAHHAHPATYQAVLTHPVWHEALAWIAAHTPDVAEGEYEIRGRDLYANVHSATTVPRSQGVYEAHKNYIDLHYCIAGGEFIEWAPVTTLTPRSLYDAAKDYTLFEVPQKASACVMTPGAFAVFLPEDAHMPKIADNTHPTVKKVVIKIRYAILTS